MLPYRQEPVSGPTPGPPERALALLSNSLSGLLPSPTLPVPSVSRPTALPAACPKGFI